MESLCDYIAHRQFPPVTGAKPQVTMTNLWITTAYTPCKAQLKVIPINWLSHTLPQIVAVCFKESSPVLSRSIFHNMSSVCPQTLPSTAGNHQCFFKKYVLQNMFYTF